MKKATQQQIAQIERFIDVQEILKQDSNPVHEEHQSAFEKWLKDNKIDCRYARKVKVYNNFATKPKTLNIKEK